MKHREMKEGRNENNEERKNRNDSLFFVFSNHSNSHFMLGSSNWMIFFYRDFIIIINFGRMKMMGDDDGVKH